MSRAVDTRLGELAGRWAVWWPAVDAAALAADVRTRADAAMRAWGLGALVPFRTGDVALVAAAGDAVLKVCPRGHPDDEHVVAEGEALAFWAPTGAVPRLLDHRDDGFTLLLERVVPGETLDDAGLPFEARLDVLGGLAARLHATGAPPVGAVPHVGAYAREWRATLAGHPALLAELDALIAAGDDEVLLHADLHGGNALRSGDGGWRVIDPHAVRGDRHADVWALVDPLVPALPEDPAAARETARGWLERYAAAARLDPSRAAAWARLRAVAEALAIDARGAGADAEDRAWATRLHRMADALAPAATG